MKRVLKVLGFGVLGLVLLVVLGLGGLYLSGKGKRDKVWEVPARAITVPTGPEAAAEGQRLFVTRGCTECHGPGAEGKIVEEDPLLGVLSAPNLTPGGRLATLDDAHVARAIRHAISGQGTALLGMPPDYAALSDGEVGAMVAYLRSLAPVTAQPPDTFLAWTGTMVLGAGMVPLAAEMIDHSAVASASTAPPLPAATARYGEYLAKVQCASCHGPELNGEAPAGKPLAEPTPTNLTPHATGLASWTLENFQSALRQGKRPDGSPLSDQMPWKAYAHLTDQEVEALWAYLREVPARAPMTP